MLPAALANLDGRLDGSIKASGTTQKPELAVDVHGRNWQLGRDAKNNDVHVKLDYQERKLDARAEVHLQQSLGSDAGALTAQLDVPIDAGAGAAAAGQRLVDAAGAQDADRRRWSSWRISIWRSFPFQQLGIAPPLRRRQHRRLARAARHAAASRRSAFDVEAHQLRRGKVDKLEVSASLDYAATQGATLDARRVAARRAAGARARRVAARRRSASSTTSRIWQTPIAVDGQVPGFDLARVQDLRAAGSRASSTPGRRARHHRQADGQARAGDRGAQPRRDEVRPLRGARAVTTARRSSPSSTRTRSSGGALDRRRDAAARRQRGRSRRRCARTASTSTSTTSNLTNPRLFKGTLDARLDVHGPRAQSDAAGLLKLDDGQLALAGRRAHLPGHQARRRRAERPRDAEERAGQGAGRQRQGVGQGRRSRG